MPWWVWMLAGAASGVLCVWLYVVTNWPRP